MPSEGRALVSSPREMSTAGPPSAVDVLGFGAPKQRPEGPPRMPGTGRS